MFSISKLSGTLRNFLVMLSSSRTFVMVGELCRHTIHEMYLPIQLNHFICTPESNQSHHVRYGSQSA